MIPSVESDRLLQAATWRTRLAEAPGTYIEPFEVWLAQDPQNGEAWKLVQGPWESLGEHATSLESASPSRKGMGRCVRASR